MRFRLLIVPAIVALGLAAPVQAQQPNRLITILTAPEPQTQLMAMILTLNAVAAGAKAEILLCGPAGDIALAAAPEAATAGQPPRGASPQAMMKMLMSERGVRVQVCALYLPSKGSNASILVEGVTPAAPDAMGASIVAPGVTVMSF